MSLKSKTSSKNKATLKTVKNPYFKVFKSINFMQALQISIKQSEKNNTLKTFKNPDFNQEIHQICKYVYNKIIKITI